ncbi:amidohydrolase family protein [Thermodesulfobacteriota bacterium]
MEWMKNIIDQEMRAGALGLSTGLVYIPGRYATTGELIELVSVLKKYNGIYATHMRGEGGHIEYALKEAIRIGEENNIQVQISHLKLMTEEAWGKTDSLTGLINAARDRGVKITADQYPYIASSAGLIAMFSTVYETLKDRSNQRAYYQTKRWLVRMLSPHLDKYTIATYIATYKGNRDYEGKNITEILKIRGEKVTPENVADLLIEMIQKDIRTWCIFYMMDEGDVEEIMKQDYVMISSDGRLEEFGIGKPHPRSYGTFPRIIHIYVKEKGVLPLETAIMKMTSLPAKTVRLSSRGLIKEKMYADIVVFDLKTIKDNATFQRPHQYPEGIKYVLVNGTIVAQDKRVTGKLPGKVLYGPGKTE